MTNEEYWTIYDAVEEGRKEDLIALLETHPEAIDSNRSFGTLLHVAASEGRLEIAKELVKRGVGLEVRGGTFEGSALNSAATNGHIDVVKYLLEEGAEMDVSDSETNPLWGAILRDNWKIVQLLIDHGADYAIKYGDDQMDAEAFAKEQGAGHSWKLLKELREKGQSK